jgi:hypothetical protein
MNATENNSGSEDSGSSEGEGDGDGENTSKKHRKIYIDVDDLNDLERIAAEKVEPTHVTDLIRYHMHSVIDRIMTGEYDPYRMMRQVGQKMKKTRREGIEIHPRREDTWERLEEAAAQANKDIDLAFLNEIEEIKRLEERDDPKVIGEDKVDRKLDRTSWWGPVREFQFTVATIVRATAREVAVREMIFSTNMQRSARELREARKETEAQAEDKGKRSSGK